MLLEGGCKHWCTNSEISTGEMKIYTRCCCWSLVLWAGKAIVEPLWRKTCRLSRPPFLFENHPIMTFTGVILHLTPAWLELLSGHWCTWVQDLCLFTYSSSYYHGPRELDEDQNSLSKQEMWEWSLQRIAQEVGTHFADLNRKTEYCFKSSYRIPLLKNKLTCSLQLNTKEKEISFQELFKR